MEWQIGEWSLLDPWFLGLVPVIWLIWFWRLRRPRAAMATASSVWFDGLPRSLRSRLIWLPGVLQALAITGLAVALARPVTREVLPVKEQGVDILLVLDVSSSMNATDMDDSRKLRRIEAARDKALEFAQGRDHDRVGLMTFALYPELRAPLTLDKDALSAFLRVVETVPERSEEDRTAIGAALAQAVRLLDESEAESRVVVFLSDGKESAWPQYEGAVDPQAGITLAADAKLRVHTIGLGGVGGYDFFGRALSQDFSLLEKIAKDTGGEFFKAVDAEALEEVYARIDEMETVELEDPRYRTSDGFVWPLLVSVALLLSSLLLQLTWIRGAP